MPKLPSERPSRPTPLDVPSGNPQAGRAGRGIVLVVEDDDDVRLEVRDALEYQGYVVLESRSGTQALEILRSEAAPKISLIILDLTMPFMSGWEFIEILRRDSRFVDVPIIVASGVRSGDASEIGNSLRWLRKPYKLEELLDTVREAVDRAQC